MKLSIICRAHKSYKKHDEQIERYLANTKRAYKQLGKSADHIFVDKIDTINYNNFKEYLYQKYGIRHGKYYTEIEENKKSFRISKEGFSF